MNKLDLDYLALLQDILDTGHQKGDRTGTGTISIFGRQIRHNMKDGFPLLTTKRIPFKLVVTELLWFLRGNTNIKYLVDNDCNIWNGDALKKYNTTYKEISFPLDMEEFVQAIKTSEEFAGWWGDLGPIYGKQWRRWGGHDGMIGETDENGTRIITWNQIDQIANLINDLKTNPDSRRLMVNAWNVSELDQMTLPPCHYGFQVYTRELTIEERLDLASKTYGELFEPFDFHKVDHKAIDELYPVPRRAISLIWNQRSVDTFLGLPFNIASYGLLLEIIAKEVNMVPDELIGNLGDTHLYLNHIEQSKEQIGRELSLEERKQIFEDSGHVCDVWPLNGDWSGEYDGFRIPKRTREPYPLPTLKIENEVKWAEGDCLPSYSISDFTIGNYQSHPTINAPLSN